MKYLRIGYITSRFAYRRFHVEFRYLSHRKLNSGQPESGDVRIYSEKKSFQVQGRNLTSAYVSLAPNAFDQEIS